MRACESRDLRLRFNCIQALLNVPAPYDFEPLFALLDDRRELFAGCGYRVADNAVWVLCTRLNKVLRREDGRELYSYSDKAFALLRGGRAANRR